MDTANTLKQQIPMHRLWSDVSNGKSADDARSWKTGAMRISRRYRSSTNVYRAVVLDGPR